MKLSGHYDKENDVLAMWTGEKEAAGASAYNPSLIVFLSAEDVRAIVGFELLAGGRAYLERKRGYHDGSDTLLIGKWAEDPAWRRVNGDLVASWHMEDGVLEPIGVTVLNAKANLANVKVV